MTGGQRGLNDNKAQWLLSLSRNAVQILEHAVKGKDVKADAQAFIDRFGGME